MKILHVSSLSTGGAYNAAFGLHTSLLNSGAESTFLVLRNTNQNVDVFPEFSKYGLSVQNRLRNKLKINAILNKFHSEICSPVY